MGASYPEAWIVTLEKLKALDFDTVLPGHGVPFKGKERITAFQDYLRDFISQAKALKAQGLTAEQAAKKIDLTKHSKMFPQIREVGIDEAVTRRFYRLAQEPNAGPPPYQAPPPGGARLDRRHDACRSSGASRKAGANELRN